MSGYCKCLLIQLALTENSSSGDAGADACRVGFSAAFQDVAQRCFSELISVAVNCAVLRPKIRTVEATVKIINFDKLSWTI